jgi:hypothetical protein
MREENPMRQVEVNALLVDPDQNTPVVLLKDLGSDKVLPLWIGNAEATAIAIGLQEKEFPRPLTHDLLRTVIDTVRETTELLHICGTQVS